MDLRINKMNKSIEHRGPDASGLKTSSKYGFGHQRLSIIDLDKRSNQPYTDEDNNEILVFNGEIFNFNEIKNKIKYDFKTESDTEVVYVSIKIKGIDWFLEKARGFYSIAFYSIKQNKLILARDRFGIKPLFYYKDNETLVFSSEIKGILESGLVDNIFNEEVIDEYLGNRYIRAPFTFFKNIYSLEPATYITLDSNFVIYQKKYWELPKLNNETNFNEKKVLSETTEVIENAFNSWFLSDVPVGSYLSGGVDSSLATALLSANNSNVNTYTIGFEDEVYNEFTYAKKVSEIYKTTHHEILYDKINYLNDWEKLIKFKDSPLSVPNEIPLARLNNELSKDIKVVISGEGADELFAGYGRIFRHGFDNNNLDKKKFYESFINQYEYVNRQIRDEYLNTSNNRQYYDQITLNDFENNSKNDSIYRFFQKYHVTGLLQRVDMTSMQASIEARPPFLDHLLIEHVYKNVPHELKLKWNNIQSKKNVIEKNLKSCEYSELYDTPKYILKKIGEKYLPDDILYRKKMGFPVPLTNWFEELERLSNEILSNVDWLKKNKIKELTSKIRNHDRSGQILWMLINVELFKKIYFNKKFKF